MIVVLLGVALGAVLYVGGFSGGDFNQWEVDVDGYVVEPLPFVFDASYVRHDRFYLAHGAEGLIRVVDGDWNVEKTVALPFTGGGPRMLFVSPRGSLFVSQGVTDEDDTFRYAEGDTWEVSLEDPVWRMDADERGNIYAGVYTSDPEDVATVYRSSDEGSSWVPVFVERDNRHIHTVRWDPFGQALYVSFGDGASRGQAYSRDYGESFQRLDVGDVGGHTDLAVTPQYLVWGSDVGSGKVYRQRRGTTECRTVLWGSQYIWFLLASGSQIYLGTMPSAAGQRGSLLASDNGGLTWQKILELDPPSSAAYDQGLYGESREAGPGGWICLAGAERAYRIRRDPAWHPSLLQAAWKRLDRFRDRAVMYLDR